ncbi:regulatory protein, tetR family [Nonomuraea solani]|uniref:Regulatory protein, tetR family n=1 Tax=Nonomuraea solani TaxID=1144553 RepID=A0A1H6ER61_9ACTN|nr:TetR family transcriptional regulator [Nonomuraea solani]SEG99903.1 regulatory protein, tetR family [Nonomuraea solani]
MTVPDPEDLTARARIRDAAMRHIGEHGFERATIRGIAESAGVSLGLVRHHFGSKQGLREACDQHLMKIIRRLHEEAEHAAPGAPGLNPIAAMGPYQGYMARALTEGWAGPLFDEMVRIGERWLAEDDEKRPDPPATDPKTRSTLIAAMALSVGVLSRHVERGMEIDLTTPEGQEKLMLAILDVYSRPLLTPEMAAAARAALRKP